MKKVYGLIIILILVGVFAFDVIDEHFFSDESEELNGGMIVSKAKTSKQSVKSVRVDKIAPDFELFTLDGDSIKLSNLKGKKVFINFWLTTCVPCKDEMPALQKFYEAHNDEVEVLAINATGQELSVEKVKEFANDFDLTFPILLDKDLETTMLQYELHAVPTTYFINTEGVVKGKHLGPLTLEMMEEKLNELN